MPPFQGGNRADVGFPGLRLWVSQSFTLGSHSAPLGPVPKANILTHPHIRYPLPAFLRLQSPTHASLTRIVNVFTISAQALHVMTTQTLDPISQPAIDSSRPALARALDNPRWGNLALIGGIAFAAVFTFIIWALGDRLVVFAKPVDQGPAWYYWKLADPTIITRLIAWGSYALHQIVSWGLIYYAQTRVKTYTKGLHPVNLVALGFNALMIAWHVAQSQLTYDGLAQDVSIFSSQGSVIIMLVWILVMENRRRGMFFGKRLPIGKSIIDAAKRYHGYVFSWAVIYTFWYHPAENTQGHLIGFFYMFLLMLQGSLFLTRLHVNRWWMVVQEVSVLFHGTLVALQQSGPTITGGIWPMFLFGFAGILIVTQIHGLGLKRSTTRAIAIGFVVVTVAFYGFRGFGQLNEVIRIPAIEYLAAVILALLIGAVVGIGRVVRRITRRPTEMIA